jgi:hypothetical protein
MISSPAIIAIVLAVFVTLAFSGGFAVSNWRASGEIQRLTSSNAVFEEANARCATDIAEVRKSIAAVTVAAAERQKAASISMVVATKTADVHTAKARQIKVMLPVQVDRQCEAIRMEQIDYVRGRTQ